MDIRYCLIQRTSVKQFKISYNTGGYFYCLIKEDICNTFQLSYKTCTTDVYWLLHHLILDRFSEDIYKTFHNLKVDNCYCLTKRTSVRSIQNNEHTTHLAYSIKSLHHTPDNLANIFGSYFPAIQHATLNVTHVWWNIGKVSRNKHR